MFAKRSIRYAERIQRKRTRNRILLYIALFIVLCIVLRTFVFQTWKVRGELMKPTLRDGDIVIVLPCLSFSDKMLISLAGIPQKGDVVLVEDGSESIVPTMTMIEDSALRFMTLQKYSLLAAEFGKGFGLPTVMRIQSIQHDKDISKSQPVYRLATDSQSDKNFMTGDRIVPPSLIKGRVVLKIWPLARIGKVQ